MLILAIDPGNAQSGWVLMDAEAYTPIAFAKESNDMVIEKLHMYVLERKVDTVVLEMIESYGMAVGRDVFDTCIWIGRFAERAELLGAKTPIVARREEKLNLCGDPRAKDTNIRRALIDRFAAHDYRDGKGTKANPDVFYGVSKDVWAAVAVGVTYLDRLKRGEPCKAISRARKAG